MIGDLQQLDDDLGIGLSVETDPVEVGDAGHLVDHGGGQRAATGAGGEEERPVDVEEDEVVEGSAVRRQRQT